MNENEQRWLEDNRGKQEVLMQALANGFELVEMRGGVVLVWGMDRGKVARSEEVSRLNKGALAYAYRSEDLKKWREIGEILGYPTSNACLVAKRYARQKGLPWPPV